MDYEGDDWFEVYKGREKETGANYDQITDHIFLGGYTAAEQKPLLQEVLKVSAILTVAQDMDMNFPEDFEYKVVEILDSEELELKQHFLECIGFIDRVVNKEGKRVLVHCAAGVSRSASVVIAYMMHHHRIPLMEAFKMVRDKRPCINPNSGFQRQLVEFEADLKKAGWIA